MTQRPLSWPRAAVFDFDGLLVDTAPYWHRAYSEALAQTGRELDAQTIAALAGASIKRAAAQLNVSADDLRSSLLASVESQRLRPLPGVREIVMSLRKRALLAVATNAPSNLVTSALRTIGLADSFDVIVSAESQPEEKPAPDVYCAVCKELDVEPAQAIAFEDSPIGALAARRAGLTVVYVPSDGLPADADIEVNGLDDPRLLGFIAER